MALWKPNQTIGKNERIGRRLFQRRGLKGAKDQKRPDKTFELYHFEETRDRQVSADRLGATSVDAKVKRYLNPRGHYAATLFVPPRPFLGWAVVKAKDLQAPPKGSPFQIAASPSAAADGIELSENTYHADIEMPQRYEAHDMAVMLKYIFEQNYHHEPCIEAQSRGPLRRIMGWVSELRRGLFHR